MSLDWGSRLYSYRTTTLSGELYNLLAFPGPCCLISLSSTPHQHAEKLLHLCWKTALCRETESVSRETESFVLKNCMVQRNWVSMQRNLFSMQRNWFSMLRNWFIKQRNYAEKPSGQQRHWVLCRKTDAVCKDTWVIVQKNLSLQGN